MGVLVLHKNYAVDLDGTLIDAIVSASGELNSEIRDDPTSGEVFNRFVSLVRQTPQFELSTLAVAKSLDAIGVIPSAIGVNLASLTNGIDFFGAKIAKGGTVTAGAAHRRLRIADGVIVPQSISIDEGGDARLSYSVTVSYDGMNDPIAISPTASLPSTPADDERFTLGPVEIGGVTITQIQGIEIDFGIAVAVDHADSDVWPTHTHIMRASPSIVIRTNQASVFGASGLPHIGAPALHSNSTIYLRKRADGGTFVADATEEHIAITVDGYAVCGNVMGASGNDVHVPGVRISTRYDGTNFPVSIDTTAALP